MGIHSTSQKLQRLAQLAKQTSMFDDPAEEINELATVVKQDIQALNQTISDLQTFSGGGPNKQSADHSHTVVDNLRARLKDATKEFKDVLTLRTDSLKVHQERKSLFTSAPDQRPPMFTQPGAPFALRRRLRRRGTTHRPCSRAHARPPPLRAGASFLPANARNPFGVVRGAGGSDGASASGEHAPLLQAQQQQQQQLAVVQQDGYLTSRQEALHQVESTIVELGSIFQQLAHMVHEQGEMAVRIDENVGDTLANVDAGQAQLLKYLNAISSNRWLVLKVFGVIMLAMMFFLMFVA
jgi:syntaxin 5